MLSYVKMAYDALLRVMMLGVGSARPDATRLVHRNQVFAGSENLMTETGARYETGKNA
jgi:hypothetical protein